MSKKIGYLTFGRDDLSYGLALCLSRLKDYELYRITPKTARYVDILLFSCFWWEHIYLLADFLRRAGIAKDQKTRPIIIVGGFNTFNPIPFSRYADAVVVGDGENVLPSLVDDLSGKLPGVYRSGDKEVEWQNVRPLIGFCHETNNIARIEIARGCKFRCKFCAVTRLKPYREVPVEQLKEVIRETRLKRVALFSPEPTLHSKDFKLTGICERLGKIRLDTDVRLDRLHKRDGDKGGVLRSGIEGISERLRRSVGKFYSNEQIIKAVARASQAGRGAMFMYFILDLPGETEEDWIEFENLLNELGEIPGAENFLLKPSPNVFMPSPHTEMEAEPINWERPYGSKWLSFFSRGGKRGWKIKMAERSRIFSPGMRVLSMLSTRSGEEFFEIERELWLKKIYGIIGGRVTCKSSDGLLVVLDNYGGVDRYCGIPQDTPWKVVKLGPMIAHKSDHQESELDETFKADSEALRKSAEEEFNP